MKCYYSASVSDFSLSMVYMVTYSLFIVPSLWLLNTTGLRPTFSMPSEYLALFSARGGPLHKYVHESAIEY